MSCHRLQITSFILLVTLFATTIEADLWGTYNIIIKAWSARGPFGKEFHGISEANQFELLVQRNPAQCLTRLGRWLALQILRDSMWNLNQRKSVALQSSYGDTYHQGLGAHKTKNRQDSATPVTLLYHPWWRQGHPRSRGIIMESCEGQMEGTCQWSKLLLSPHCVRQAMLCPAVPSRLCEPVCDEMRQINQVGSWMPQAPICEARRWLGREYRTVRTVRETKCNKKSAIKLGTNKVRIEHMQWPKALICPRHLLQIWTNECPASRQSRSRLPQSTLNGIMPYRLFNRFSILCNAKTFVLAEWLSSFEINIKQLFLCRLSAIDIIIESHMSIWMTSWWPWRGLALIG